MSLMEKAQRVAYFQRGTTTTEYTLMLGLIVAVALGAIGLLGQDVCDLFTQAHNSLPTGG